MTEILLWIFGCGCVGGLAHASRTGFKLPYFNHDCHTWFPGGIGEILVGGVAALAFWGVYGPLADATMFGQAAMASNGPTISLGELFGSVLIGAGGGRFITTEATRHCLKDRLERHSPAKDKAD